MEGDFKVRAVDFEEKSVAEVEEQLIKEHEEKTGITSTEEAPVDKVVIEAVSYTHLTLPTKRIV